MPLAKVLWAAATDLPAGWPLLSHAHPFFHLFRIRSGKAKILIDGKPYMLTSGSCIIIPPGCLHEIPADEHSLLITNEVKFTIEDENLRKILTDASPVVLENAPYVGQSIQNILYSWATGAPGYRDNSDIYLSAMLLSVATEQPLTEAHISTYIDTAPYPKLIKQIIRYIEDNHAESFSLDLLAGELGYNKRYLCSAFKNSTGITILDYLNHVRIRHATNCFYYYDVPITVIAQFVGFITPVHFTRVFKKLVGISPSRFRSCYCLANIDATENQRLTTPQFSVYEEVLGVKILPLEEAIRALRELGKRAN